MKCIPCIAYSLGSVAAWLALASSVVRSNEARVVIISPHVESIRLEFVRGFEAWHERKFGSKAVVDWRNLGGTSDALKYVQSEFSRKPEGIGVDVFFGGGTEPFLLLTDKKLTQPCDLPPDVLAAIPPKLNGMDLYDPGRRWFGAVLSSFGILQNLRVEALCHLPYVTRWEELTQPALVGWVGCGDPRNSGTMNVMFESFLQARGWQPGWQQLTQLGANVRKFDRLSSTTAKDVTLGETAYALAIDFYGYTQVTAAGASNVAYVLPQDFATVNPDGICLLRGAPNATTGMRFIEFVLSEEGQKLWLLPRGHAGGPQWHTLERPPMRPDLYTTYRGQYGQVSSPFDLNFSYNSKLGRERREVVNMLAGALLVDTHPELLAAWRGVIRRGMRSNEVAELGRMPVTETEALKLAKESFKDATFRNAKKIEWQTWAQEKYRRLR